MGASFTISEVLEATGAVRVRAGGPWPFSGVSTDTRTVASGELFVALKGDNFDGADFVAEAAAKGAAGAVVEAGRAAALKVPEGLTLFAVPDPLAALGALARRHRRRFSFPVLAVTGSNGKTTTKELMAAIAALRGPALKSEGNLNNEVGVPLTLFRLQPEQRTAIVEMGMNHAGEIARLTAMAEPRVGVVTNAHAAHLAGMGTVEAVARAKGELYRGLPADGVAVANADDPRVLAEARASGRQVITFGRDAAADVRLVSVEGQGADGLRFTVREGGRNADVAVRLKLVGAHNALNACAAWAALAQIGMSAEQIVEGLGQARPTPRRLNVRRLQGGAVLLDDCYNANPASMRAALETLRALAGPGGRAFAALGDMLELGAEEDRQHRALGEIVGAAGLAGYLAFGPRSRAAAEAARGAAAGGALEIEWSDDPAAALAWLRARLRSGDVVLVKGSRGMRMERIAEGLEGPG